MPASSAKKKKVAAAAVTELPKSLTAFVVVEDSDKLTNTRTRIVSEALSQAPLIAAAEDDYRTTADRLYRPFASLVAQYRGTFAGSRKGTHDWTGRTQAYRDAIAAVYEACWPDPAVRSVIQKRLSDYLADAVRAVAPADEMAKLGQAPTQLEEKAKEKAKAKAKRDKRIAATKKSLDSSPKVANAVVALEEAQASESAAFTIEAQLNVLASLASRLVEAITPQAIALEDLAACEASLLVLDSAVLDIDAAIKKAVTNAENAEAERTENDENENDEPKPKPKAKAKAKAK